MKTKQICAMALAALSLFGFSACNDNKKNNDPEQDLKLSETSISMKVGETHTLTANITVDAWASNDETIATVADGVVTAVKDGNAIITATAGSQTKTCIVAVTKDGQQGDGGSKVVKGSQIWPIILDGTTTEANASKTIASFAPNDVDQFLYVWDNTYTGGTASGMNFYGNTDGYTTLIVASGWSGCGFCLTEKGTGWQAAEALRAAIVADPDSYYLHMGIKSTDNYSHCFYIFGSEATKFVLGKTAVYDGPVYQDFTRDGSWQEFDIPMSKYATALSSTTCAAGVNVFVALTEGVVGAQLNLDAVYFYKK